MAFYSHNFYRDDCGHYNLDLYGDDTYNSAAAQALMAYSSYEFKESNFIDYGAYDHVQSEPVISHSTFFFREPKVIEYDPSTHYIDGDYNLLQSRYIVSYSTLGFNEDDDVDYDPTPYGGGYDPSLTYGKPLSPSDEICYPRSTLDNSNITLPSLDGFSNGSPAFPLSLKEEVGEKLEKPHVEEASKGHGNGNDEKGNDLASKQDEQKEGTFINYSPTWIDYDHGYGNGRIEDHTCEYEKPVPQTPCGYGSSAMDLCESIFGYWPMLSRKDDNSCGHQGVYHGDGNNLNQWKGTADYLFESSNSCGDWRVEAGMYDSPIFGYERHSQEPLQHGQFEYEEHIYDCQISEHEFSTL